MYSLGRNKNFIFIHIPKTGGASIKNHLISCSHGNSPFAIQYLEKYYGSRYHAILINYSKELKPAHYEAAYKFSIVRNPWDRLLSLYKWKRSGTSDSHYNETLKKANKRLVDGLTINQRPGAPGRLDKTVTFKNFVEGFKEVGKYNNEIWPYSLYLDHLFGSMAETTPRISGHGIQEALREPWGETAHKINILRFENLQEDYNQVCDTLGFDRTELLHIHKTEHAHYTEYYDDKSKDIVYKTFKEDIDKYGYEFK